MFALSKKKATFENLTRDKQEQLQPLTSPGKGRYSTCPYQDQDQDPYQDPRPQDFNTDDSIFVERIFLFGPYIKLCASLTLWNEAFVRPTRLNVSLIAIFYNKLCECIQFRDGKFLLK